MRCNGKFELRAVITIYHCSDGKLRPVQFGPKTAKQIHGYITHIQGGVVDLLDEPCLLVRDTPQIQAAIDALEKPEKTLRSLVVEKFKRIFGNAKPIAVKVPVVGAEREISSARPSGTKVSRA
jgi:hypothetical protein